MSSDRSSATSTDLPTVSPELQAFHAFFDPRKQEVQERLERVMRTASDALSKEEPRLKERAEAEYQLVTGGGKRLRGVLAMVGHEFAGGSNTELGLTMATAVELFHAAILVHDDIIDRDALRRGLPTMHEQFGVDQAILIGDRLAILGYQTLLQSPGDLPTLFEALAVLHAEGYKTALGAQLELLDVGLESHHERAVRASRLKTAHYSLVAPVQAGALLAGRRLPKLMIQALIKLGELFQWKDDALGVLGTQQQLGKPRASDWREGRITPIWMELERRLDNAALEEMRTLMRDPQEDQLEAWIERYDIASKIHEILNQKASQLRQGVKMLFIPRQQKEVLFGFIEFIWTRTT